MSRLAQKDGGGHAWTSDYRSVPHDEAMRHAGQLISECFEAHGPAVGQRVAYEFLASNRDGAYAVWCDHATHGLQKGEARQWLWLAASLGHPEAREVLASMMRGRSLPRHPPAPEAVESFVYQDGPDRSAGPGRTAFDDFDVRDEPEPNPYDDAALAVLAAVQPAAPSHSQATSYVPLPGRIVIPRIGEADSRDGKELAKRFKDVVGATLPFVGQVPALDEVAHAVRERWPWASRAADQLERHMSVLRVAGSEELRIRPLLFVGEPGCGKTSVARFVSDMLGLPSVMVSCGGTADAGGLASVTRGWSTARPSMITMAFVEHRCANPVAILDEIDKSSAVGSQNGSVQGTLLQMLQASDYYDSCLMGPVDMRSATFVATCNHLSRIDPGLLQRFEVIAFDRPGKEHFDVLLANCRTDFSRAYSIPPNRVPVLGRGDRRLLMENWLGRRRSARSFAELHEMIVKDIMLSEERQAVADAEVAQAAWDEATPRTLN